MISWLEKHMLPCFIKSLTGHDCPGCGFQRSFIALLRGQVHESVHLYPPLFPILLTFLFLAFHLSFRFHYQHVIMRLFILLMAGSILINFLIKLI